MAVRIVQCQHCHQSFEARDWRETRPTRYCSRACRDLGMSTRVTLVCMQCDQPFERKAYQAEWSTERGPFCSMKCYGWWQRENIAGPLAPTWGHETNPNGRGSHRSIRQRDLALARDGHHCVVCGSSSNLHVHHVLPWEAGQADPHALDNLSTLCALHHRRAHRALGGQ